MILVKNIKEITRKLVTEPHKFNCKLHLGKGLSFQMWERPGRWCTPKDLDQMIKDINIVVRDSSIGKAIPKYGVLLGDIDDLRQRVISIIYNKEKHPIAFSAQAYIDLDVGIKKVSVLHLGLVYISPKARGKNLTSLVYSLPSLVLMLKGAFRSQWVSNVTQVPAVFGLVQDFYTTPFPNINDRPATLEHKILAQKIFDHGKEYFGVGEDAEFDSKMHIIKNSYTGGSNNLKKSFKESTPYRGNEKVNIYMEKNLDYNRGDDVLQLAKLDMWIFVRVLKDKVIRNNISLLVFNSLIIIFILLVLPYLRWLFPVREEQLSQTTK